MLLHFNERFFSRITCSNSLYTINVWPFVNEIKMGYFLFEMVCLHSKVFLCVYLCEYIHSHIEGC